MQITNSNIDEYLDRFFEGETSNAEEAEIIRYFREEPFLPERLTKYREMFGWIDAGMPEEKRAVSQRRRNIFQRQSVRWISVAAVIALIVGVSISVVRFNWSEPSVKELPSTSENKYAEYKGSFIEYNGIRNTDIAKIMPQIQSTLRDIDQMEYELSHLSIEPMEFNF